MIRLVTIAPDAGPVLVRVLRWIARAASLGSLGLLAMFATSGGDSPSASEWLLLAFFPIGVAVGMVLAWWREILGGTVAGASLAAFHLIVALDNARPFPGVWFLVFTSPALALLACGFMTRASLRRSAA